MKKILLTLMAVFGLVATADAQTPAELAGKYYGDLYISLGEAINDETEPIPGQCVDIAVSAQEGCIDFALYNFALGDEMQLGDILLPAIGVNAADGLVKFAENPIVKLTLNGGIEADANLNHNTSWIKGDELSADVDVVWTNDGGSGTPIYVRFVGVREAAAQPANAFHPFDGSFNLPWKPCLPWDSTNGYDFKWSEQMQGNYDIFIQPQGWTVADVIGIGGLGATCVAKRDTVAKGDYAVRLANTPNPFMASQIVPGYMTLGTSWATAKAGFTSVSNADGGTFGGIEFNQLPDAITLRYKRSHGEANATEPATVVAYLWKGTYTQADVPGETKLMANPSTVTMTDRDRNILGVNTDQGGEVTKTDDAACIAHLVHYIDGDAAEWTDLTVGFDYGEFSGTGTLPEKMNIILSANDYFGDRNKMGKGNSLTVDDVRLVYYSTLKELGYEGKELGFSEDITSYDLSDVTYDAGKLSYAKKGQGASVSTAYDEATATLTVLVKGADAEVNPANETAYTLQFKQNSTGIGAAQADRSQNGGVYSISGVRVADRVSGSLPKGIYIVGGKKVVVK